MWKLAALALLILVGAGAGTTGTLVLYAGPKISKLTGDLAEARRAAISERAAREAAVAQCEAGGIATGRRDDIRDAAQQAIDNAMREIDHADPNSDDPLRDAFERLRQGGAAPGAGGRPDSPAGNPSQSPAPR